LTPVRSCDNGETSKAILTPLAAFGSRPAKPGSAEGSRRGT
jgi:hypothetical protein